jgi:hypothetical protein
MMAALWLGIIALVFVLLASLSRRGGHAPGAGASGAVYDMLNEDKRKAVEIILEDRAEARDPETADDTVDEAPRST